MLKHGETLTNTIHSRYWMWFPSAMRICSRLPRFMKIKLKRCGLRVFCQLVRTEQEMHGIVIGARADDKVYNEANSRIDKCKLTR